MYLVDNSGTYSEPYDRPWQTMIIEILSIRSVAYLNTP